MLSAAVSGNIFASPSVSQIVEAIGTVGGSAGTILIVKNYTGDIFHFHLAAAKARLRWGHHVEVLVVGDDVAIGRQRSGKVGRRGLAGTVLVHKILGALAEQGSSIDELLQIGKQVVDSLVTCGVSQGHVHVPGSGSIAQEEESNIELGMGIHNEPGYRSLVPRPSLEGVLKHMLDMLLDTQDSDRAYVDFSHVAPVLMVNNLGATSQLELYAILHEALQELGKLNASPLGGLNSPLRKTRASRRCTESNCVRDFYDKFGCSWLQHNSPQGHAGNAGCCGFSHYSVRMAADYFQWSE
jgi:dihydroxyacetone kinase